MTAANNLAVRRALEDAGVEFIDENGGGPGVRLRKRQRAKKAEVKQKPVEQPCESTAASVAIWPQSASLQNRQKPVRYCNVKMLRIFM